MVVRISDKTQNYSKVTKLLVKPYYYKAKVYYNLDVNDFIVIKDVNENKIYIFNFDTNQQTQDFYDLLCKKVDKVGVSYTESHYVHH